MVLPRHTLLAFVATAVAAFCATAVSAADTMRLTLPSGREMKAEVMVKPEDRAMGLMFRPSLPQDQVLLFVFDVAEFHGIWMKNCRFPIDIVWLDAARKVVHVEEKVPPCKEDPCPSYRPMRRALYVLEIGAGQARREKTLIGSTLSFTLRP